LVLCIAGVIATFVMQGRALDVERARAQGVARAVADEVDGALGTTQLNKPISGDAQTSLRARLQHALTGQSILAVRVWTPSGVLRLSTLAKDRSQPLLDVLQTATKGTGRITSVFDTDVMTSYIPLRDGPNGAPFGAVEVQQPYAPVLAASASPWATVRLGVGALGVLMLLFLGLGVLGGIPVRRSAREGAGFARSRGSTDAAFDREGEPQMNEVAEVAADPLPTRELRAGAVMQLGSPAPVAPPPAATDEPPAPSEEAVELERVREELKALNRRTGARITELQDELDRTRTQLQEARKAAIPTEGPSAAERVRELQDQLRAENMRAGTAEARIKGLEAQLKLQESKIAELTESLDDVGSDASRAAG